MFLNIQKLEVYNTGEDMINYPCGWFDEEQLPIHQEVQNEMLAL